MRLAVRPLHLSSSRELNERCVDPGVPRLRRCRFHVHHLRVRAGQRSRSGAGERHQRLRADSQARRSDHRRARWRSRRPAPPARSAPGDGAGEEPGARGNWWAAGANRQPRPVGGLQAQPPVPVTAHLRSRRADGVRLRSHRVPERRRLPHAGRLPGAHDDASDRARMPTRGSRGSRRCPTTTSRTSPTCGAASKTQFTQPQHRRRSRARCRPQAGGGHRGGQPAAAAVRADAADASPRPCRRNIATRRWRSCETGSARRSARSRNSWRRSTSPPRVRAISWRTTPERRGHLSLPGPPRDDHEP